MNGRTKLWTVAAVMGVFALTLAGCPLLPDADDLSIDFDDFDIDTSDFIDTDKLLEPKEIVIDTVFGGCFSFHENVAVCDDLQGVHDIMVEPHCVEVTAICGNWLATEFTSLDDVTEPPELGYSTDGECPEVVLNQVLVFQLKDGTYAKAIVTQDLYDSTTCDHQLSVEYVYPMIIL